MTLKDFGTNIAKLRLDKEMSAYELSLRIGKDASYINKVESGKVNVSFKAMIEICQHLDVKPQVLFALGRLCSFCCA